MLFSSFTFIFVFLPIVWIVFHLLKNAKFKSHYTIAKIFLIISSLFFYAFWKVAYLPILLSSIIINYTLAKLILKNSTQSFILKSNATRGGGNYYLDSNKFTFLRFTPKFYFIVGIIFNLCLLGFFKYTDFLLENFNTFSKLLHLDFDIPLPHILLPLALSFVTFQQIAFLFDCYKQTKGELRENLYIDFVDYALFISFFPQLIAGPIVHHREMMPQFAKMGVNSACGDLSRSTFACFVNGRQNPISSFASHNHKNSHTILEFASYNGIVESNNQSLQGVSSPKQSTTINYEYLAKGIFIFSIGLFKKVFIADSFAKWANEGFSVVEQGGVLNILESWVTSLSYTFQLYFDFSGYCDMAMGLALMFGIILPLNFDSPYKSLNIAEFWRRWHITLGRFLKECLYIPLGGNRGKGNSSLVQPSWEIEKSLLNRQQSYLTQDTRIANDSQKQSYITKILTLRNLFIVAFLSGVWHGAGFGFIIWGILHGVAMVVHRIYSWIHQSLNQTNAFIKFMQTKSYKILCWFITFNFINIAWIFFRAENLNGAMNLIKGMFGVVNVEIPHKWSKIVSTLQGGTNEIIIWIVCAFIVCLVLKNSFEMLKNFDTQYLRFRLSLRIFSKKIYLKGGAVFTHFVLTITLFYIAIWVMLSNLLDSNAYTPFLYFNF